MEEQGMVERVARAIMEDSGGGRDRPDFNWRYYESAARAAIEAMRKPTEAMVEASAAIYGDDWRNRHEYSKDQWKAMIDAALKEQEKA